MDKHQVETEFQQKYGNTGELICPTDYTDGSSKYGRKDMYHTPRRMQHSHHLQKRDRTECGNYRGISLLSTAGKIIARILLNKPKHNRHDLLPTTTPGKVHRAGSTSVYCLCRLHEGIRHYWEDWTMEATEEI